MNNGDGRRAPSEFAGAETAMANARWDLDEGNVPLVRSNDDIQRGLDNANALLDAVPQPLVILDTELRVEKANLAFHRTFGLTVDRIRHRLLTDILGAQWSQPALLSALDEVLANGTTLDELEVDVDFPRIGVRNTFVNARRLGPERGLGPRLLLTMEDRTEVKRAERKREAILVLEHDARERAEAADRLKDQFVAVVSHELRGPLNVISGWMNILVGAGPQPDPHVLAKALSAIGRGVAAQTRLLSDLLDHSRIVTGKLELQRVAIDLVTVAEAALVGVRAAADAKDITLVLSGDRATSVVLGDADRMQQVLWNLLLNAVKFTPTGGYVRISVGRIGNQVHVTVRDNGRGISDSFLPHVFDRFRQAENSSNRTQQGLGLGLTLVRELVELHGGTVDAASTGVGHGSVFTVILPIPTLLQPAPDSVVPAAADSERPPSFRPWDLVELPKTILAGTTLLVVDDEIDARDALASLLESYGALVFTAASVADAMVALARQLPDVLVSDLGMPGEDGYELMRRVRRLPESAGGQIPSVAVSAYATEKHRQQARNSGFQAYLEKPVATTELVSQIAELARRKSRLE